MTAFGSPDTAAAPVRAATPPQRVTLLTGDVVTFTAGNPSTVTLESGKGQGLGAYTTEQRGDDLYVIPKRARARIAAGTVDKELFNVRRLVREGHATGALPVLFTRSERAARNSERAADLPGTSAVRQLPAVNGESAHVDRTHAEDFWAQLDRTKAKIWLDRKLKVSLDRSVPMIGAPQVWADGTDGTGVKVAILDTGVDGEHPDLKGKVGEAKDFTGSGDTKDGHGHGTHVASTIAGSGAASGGKYKGAAPGAELLAGKVCDDTGSCESSAILAGMDWAAHSGARVVNISLGGEPSDGTDPLSQAVNHLTDETGTLFVVAAGNSGCDACVSTPAAADQALAVGAVDKSDKPASFSSRGPRLGDSAVKPEISAPGVAITAARAAGTAMGTPADEHYTAASGTSMATPHVSGAAALLAQARPGAKAADLKSALVTTAKDDGIPVFAQGAGRLRVDQAADTSVNSSIPAPYGTITQSTDRKVTYTNTGDTPVTLDLSVQVKDASGQSAPAKAVTLADTSVTVPAGGTAATTVTADPAAAPPGTYGGVVTATSADGKVALRTPVSYREAAPTTTVTVKVLGFDGSPSTGYPTAYLAGGGEVYGINLKNGVGQVDVPAGTYTAVSAAPDQATKRTAWVVDANHAVVDGTGTEIVLDARKAVPAKTTTTEPTEILNHQVPLSVMQGNHTLTFLGNIPAGWQMYVTPTAAMNGDDNRIVVQDHYTLKAPGATGSSPKALYNLNYSQDDGVPDTLEHAVDPDQLDSVETEYHADVPDLTLRRAWYGMRKGAASVLMRPDIRLEAPAALTEYVNRDDQIAWTRYAELSDAASPANKYALYNRAPFTPAESWFSGPITQAAPGFVRHDAEGGDVFWPHKNINDSVFGHILDADQGRDYPVTWKLFRGDTEIPGRRLPGSNVPEFPMPDQEATYTLKSSMVLRPTAKYAPSLATRSHSPRVDTDWVFTSKKATGDGCAIPGAWVRCDYQPTLQLQYDLGLDLHNQAPGGTEHTFHVDVAHQKNAVGGSPVTGLKLAYSTDEGATWKDAAVSENGEGSYQATVTNPAAGGTVWLRTEATDENGGKVTQTVQKAYSTT